MLTADNKNIPVKAHKVPLFMRFNKIYRNLTIVCIFDIYFGLVALNFSK